MASPTPKRTPTPRQYPPRPPAGPPEIINPFWLLKAVAVTIVVAVFCAYLTLCLLVYQGQWQLILHPDTNPKLTTTLPVQPIRFGASDTGQPTLAGLWLPTERASSLHTPTILYLPDGSGRLADDLPALTQLHQLPVNIFAFDYRGFGSSDLSSHPSQTRMAQDAATALDFLINTRHVDPRSIVPYGVGLGAALATTLCAQHPELPALILESPIPDPFQIAQEDYRASFVPLSLLFHERFEIGGPLKSLKTPKLLLTAGPSFFAINPTHPLITPPSIESEVDALYKSASTPSFTAHLSRWNPAALDLSRGPAAAYRESILRFLNEYLPPPQPAQGPIP